jgi:hypothetical protein
MNGNDSTTRPRPRPRTRRTIHCCRFEDGDAFDLEPQKVVLGDDDDDDGDSDESPGMVHANINVHQVQASTLERALSRRLAVAENDNDDDDDEDVVQFLPRYDAHWLHCTPPVHAISSTTATATAGSTSSPMMMTLLGIFEDEGDEDAELNVTLYTATATGTTTPQLSCTCQAPHSDWKPQPRPESCSASQQVEVEAQAQGIALSWIDLRQNLPVPLLTSEAGVVHFLRSVLTEARHVASSPWVVEPQPEFTVASTSNSTSTSTWPPDMVVLVLPAPLAILQDFRVSDACPSWFLHGYATCDELELPELLNWNHPAGGEPFWNSTSVGENPAAPATLYTYKQLKPRPRLSRQHPLAQDASSAITTTTIGCLWETVPPPPPPPPSSSLSEQTQRQAQRQRQRQEPTYRLVGPPYVNFFQNYSERVHQLFSEQALQVFTKEALNIPQWTPWPETQHYKATTTTSSSSAGGKPWTVFPLCYCFPSNAPERLTWVEATKSHCPETCRLLHDILGTTLRTALFSQLEAGTILSAHTGWADLANYVLRLHIPLVVPQQQAGLCGTWVDGCVETHHVGRPLLFDDSKIHRAFNYCSKQHNNNTNNNNNNNETRIVLIVDLERPSHLPMGHATGGHSEELDAFIQQMSMPI